VKAAVLVWLIAATVWADPVGSSNAPPEEAIPPPPFAKGPLVSIDLEGRQLVVQTPDGPRPFLYTERTYIFRAGQKVAADKLERGDTIALRYRVPTNGVPVVHRMKAYPPPPPVPSPVPPEPLPAPTEIAPESPGSTAE